MTDDRPPATKRQAAVVRALVALTAKQGYPPTFRELAAKLGISSPNGIACHLRALREKGYVEWAKGKSRTLRAR